MTPMEIIALVLSIAVLLKALLFLFNPGWIMSLLKTMHKYIVLQSMFVSIAILALGIYLLYFVDPVFLIVTSMFGMMTFALVLLFNSKLYLSFGKEVLKNRKALIPTFLIWVILAVWTLWKLFG